MSGKEIPNVSTLDDALARIEKLSQPDTESLPTHTHARTGIVFRIGYISDAGYDSIEKAKQAGDSKTMKLLYLLHGIESPKLEREQFKKLLDADSGAANAALINAIKQLNPPREQLTAEYAFMFASSSANVVFWRVAMEIGLGKALLDYLAPSATEEEKGWAALQLRKVEETLKEFEAYFDVEESARALGVTFKDAAKLNAGTLATPGTNGAGGA